MPATARFDEQIAVLSRVLAHRHDVVEHVQDLLNAQRKPPAYLQDRALLARHVDDGFVTRSGLTPAHLHLQTHVEAACWADGFKPRPLAGLHNGLADPAEMMIRAFHVWQHSRWPGRNGRVRYAHTLFNLYVLRWLARLGLRLWDDGPGAADACVSRLQQVLDQLLATTPAGQPTFVRDARWLVPLAQSPATDDLGAYFRVAQTIAETLSHEHRLEIHRAGARMAAGHLRSQTRYYALKKAVPFDEPSVKVLTRGSNALDYALLVQDLVPLLTAYEQACRTGDATRRHDLADSICQGISPDPELFVNRLDLLGAYSMVEHVFISVDSDGRAVYTPLGQRHTQLLREYEARLDHVAHWLHEDCPRFRPVAGTYSPYGALFGFSSNLIEHMALKAAQPETIDRFSLEDVFAAGDAKTLAWVSGWRKLPHLPRDVEEQFDYPQSFAEDVFARVETEVGRRASGADAPSRAGRLLVLPDGGPQDPETLATADLPVHYVQSTDLQWVGARKAQRCDEAQLESDRREGRCLLSFRTPGGWVAISKALLTEHLGAARDAKLAGLPPGAAAALALMSPPLVRVRN